MKQGDAVWHHPDQQPQWPAYIGARKWFGTFPAPAVVDTDEEDEDALAPAGKDS